jgi:hypothetical protein
MVRVYNSKSSTGNFDGQTSGSSMVGARALHVGQQRQDLECISAKLSVTGLTTSSTISARWQGSDDGVSWEDIASGPSNPDPVALVTGTGTAIAVSLTIPAPSAVYGYKYARALPVFANTIPGVTTDAWSVSYAFRRQPSSEDFNPATEVSAPVQSDGTIITQFQAGHGWTNAYGGAGSTDLNYTDDHYYGSQCVRLVTDGAATIRGVKKWAMTSMDFTAKMLKIAIKISGSAHFAAANAGIYVYLGSSSLSKYYLWTPWNSQVQQALCDDVWYNFSLPFFADPALLGSSGSPDRTSLTDITIRIKDDGTSNPVTAYVGQASITPESPDYAAGLISFRFDDCYASTFSVVEPMFRAKGWQASLPVIVELVGGSNRVTVEQLKRLDSAGWDVCHHAYASAAHTTGYPALDANAVLSDMGSGIAWLQSQGLRGWRSMAYPLGYFTYGGSTNAMDLARRKFKAAGTISSATLESCPPSDPLRMRAYTITYPSSTLANMKTMVDRAVSARLWLQFVLHEIVDSPSTSTQWATSDLQALVDYIAATYPTTPIKTIGHALSLLS